MTLRRLIIVASSPRTSPPTGERKHYDITAQPMWWFSQGTMEPGGLVLWTPCSGVTMPNLVSSLLLAEADGQSAVPSCSPDLSSLRHPKPPVSAAPCHRSLINNPLLSTPSIIPSVYPSPPASINPASQWGCSLNTLAISFRLEI